MWPNVDWLQCKPMVEVGLLLQNFNFIPVHRVVVVPCMLCQCWIRTVSRLHRFSVLLHSLTQASACLAYIRSWATCTWDLVHNTCHSRSSISFYRSSIAITEHSYGLQVIHIILQTIHSVYRSSYHTQIMHTILQTIHGPYRSFLPFTGHSYCLQTIHIIYTLTGHLYHCPFRDHFYSF